MRIQPSFLNRLQSSRRWPPVPPQRPLWEQLEAPPSERRDLEIQDFWVASIFKLYSWWCISSFRNKQTCIDSVLLLLSTCFIYSEAEMNQVGHFHLQGEVFMVALPWKETKVTSFMRHIRTAAVNRLICVSERTRCLRPACDEEQTGALIFKVPTQPGGPTPKECLSSPLLTETFAVLFWFIAALKDLRQVPRPQLKT